MRDGADFGPVFAKWGERPIAAVDRCLEMLRRGSPGEKSAVASSVEMWLSYSRLCRLLSCGEGRWSLTGFSRTSLLFEGGRGSVRSEKGHTMS